MPVLEVYPDWKGSFCFCVVTTERTRIITSADLTKAKGKLKTHVERSGKQRLGEEIVIY
jgi:hypothetical protein